MDQIPGLIITSLYFSKIAFKIPDPRIQTFWKLFSFIVKLNGYYTNNNCLENSPILIAVLWNLVCIESKLQLTLA